MGLSIKDIIPRREIELDELDGKTLCVDAFNILYQFLTTVRQPDGTPLMDDNQNITSHLSGLFYRNVSLLSSGLKLVYVFDGEPPELKGRTHEIRKGARENAQEKYRKAEEDENVELMRKYSSSFIRLDEKMIEESKELLESLGIAVVQAPSEGEAEAAHLARVKNNVYGSVSQDYDSLLFGTPRLIRNLTLSRKRKSFGSWVDVAIECIELDKVLNSLEINLDQLICLGILVGTDYNPKGIPGIGQKRALDIVRKYKQPILIFQSLEEQMLGLPDEDRFDWKEIFRMFKDANVRDADFEFGKINEEKIKEILIGRHNFSEERVEKQLDKLREIREKQKQKALDKWF